MSKNKYIYIAASVVAAAVLAFVFAAAFSHTQTRDGETETGGGNTSESETETSDTFVTTADETTRDAPSSAVTTVAETEPEPPVMLHTVRDLLAAAMEPVGRCLYVYGGGWNEDDTGAGTDAVTFGASPRWYEFFLEHDKDYDYREYRYQIHDGLDCSGFVGYTIYQVFGSEHGVGYVFKSGETGEKLTEIFGGKITSADESDGCLPGDIMFRNGHVYIVIGVCEDGSVLFVHASSPVVSLCGTPSPDGDGNSEAVALALRYMENYRPECYEKFGSTCSRGMSYLTDYSRYRWDASTLADPDGYYEMSAEEILADLFERSDG